LGAFVCSFSLLLRFSKETKKPENPFEIKDFQAFYLAEMEHCTSSPQHRILRNFPYYSTFFAQYQHRSFFFLILLKKVEEIFCI